MTMKQACFAFSFCMVMPVLADTVMCTTNTRSTCYDSGCAVARDPTPSVYKISGLGERTIRIEKFINGRSTSSYEASKWADRNDNFLYVEKQYVLSTIAITNDMKRFVITLPSGLSSYNRDLESGTTPDPSIGAQVETGACVSL
jgi:hypothetical protein